MSGEQQMVVGVINFGQNVYGKKKFSFTELQSESNYCKCYYEIRDVVNGLPVGRRTKEMDDKMWDAIYEIRDLLSKHGT